MKYECVRKLIDGELHDLVFMDPEECWKQNAWRIPYAESPLNYWNASTDNLWWIPVPIIKVRMNLDEDGYMI